MPISRAIDESEHGDVGRLLNSIFRTNKHVFDQDVLTDFPLVFVAENYRNCRVVEIDNKIVSHAGIFQCELVIHGTRLKTAIIILVATYEEHRHQGYAAHLMRDLQQIMYDESYDLGVLWTGVPEFYAKLGWQTVTTKGFMIDDLRSGPLPFAAPARAPNRIERYDARDHLDGIIAIHDREPIRIERSREEYSKLLVLPKISTWVLRGEQEVRAYIVVGQAINKRGIIEYGGRDHDVLPLIAHVSEHEPLEGSLPLLMFNSADGLAGRCEGTLKPLQSSKGSGIEMVYIVRPEQLLSEVLDDLFVWGLDFT